MLLKAWQKSIKLINKFTISHRMASASRKNNKKARQERSKNGTFISKIINWIRFFYFYFSSPPVSNIKTELEDGKINENGSENHYRWWFISFKAFSRYFPFRKLFDILSKSPLSKCTAIFWTLLALVNFSKEISLKN